MPQWTDTDRPLAHAALLAVAIGVLGDLYLAFGRASGAALSPAGLLWPLLAVAGLAAIGAIGLRQIAGARPVFRLAALAAVLPLALFTLALLCVPPIARDELTHHLAIPALYVGAGRITEIPFADQSYYPMLVEMFYTPLLAWLPDNSPKVVHLLFGVAAASVVALGAARRGGPNAGLLAATLVLLTPAVATLLPTAYVDLGLLLYVAVAILTLLRWFESGSVGWFVLSALSTGFACATKYNGLLVLVLLGLGTALGPRRRNPAAAIAVGAAYVLVALLPFAPWLIKNAVETGNPIFPLFNGLFDGRPLPERPFVDVLTRRRILHGESWLEIAAVPLRIFVSGREGTPARFDGVLNPVFLAGIAFAATRAQRRETRLLLGFAAAYFLIAFFQTDMRVRYLLPIVPPLAWITAAAFTEIAPRRAALVGCALAAGLVFTFAHAADRWRHTDPLAYLLGHEDRATYLARFVPELPVVEYANANLPGDARVYLAFLGTRSYYCRRPFTYETYYSGSALRRSVESSDDAAGVLSRLRTSGITHMIAADGLLAVYLTHNLNADQLERWRAFASSHLHRLASRNGVSLYEIG